MKFLRYLRGLTYFGYITLVVLHPRQALADSTASKSIKTIDDFVLADGVQVHYVKNGAGRPVVFLHGNDGTAKDFTMSIFDKAASKYQAIVFDRPGHGLSKIITQNQQTPQMQARVIHAALNKLGIKKPILVAHSWSGALALSYALQFPNDLSALVMLGAMAYATKQQEAKPIYYTVEVPLLSTLVAAIAKYTYKSQVEHELALAFAPDKAPQPYVRAFLSSFSKISQLKAAVRDEMTVNSAFRKMSSYYNSINIPTIILCGDKDNIVDPELHSFPLHRAMPKSQLTILHNAGHELQFTRQAEVISAIDQIAASSVATVTAQSMLK